MEQSLFLIFGLGAPLCAVIFAFVLIRQINQRDAGNERMQNIAALIRSGAMAFFRVEYSVLAVFVGIMFIILRSSCPGAA